MRYLIIVRHAEAEDHSRSGRDYERSLTQRGRRQCQALRELARDPHSLGAYGPVTALVSGATRARETFSEAFGDLGFVASVEYSDLIYNGRGDVSAEDVLIELAALDPVTTSLLVVGHNPTLRDLVDELAIEVPSPLERGHLPKAATVVLALEENEPVGLKRYHVVAAFRPA